MSSSSAAGGTAGWKGSGVSASSAMEKLRMVEVLSLEDRVGKQVKEGGQ